MTVLGQAFLSRPDQPERVRQTRPEAGEAGEPAAELGEGRPTPAAVAPWSP
jgi:hypothetical protein